MSDSPLVTLANPAASEALASGLWKFFLEQRAVNCEFCWGGKTIRAHRLVLEVFFPPERLDQLSEKPMERIDLNDPEERNNDLHSIMEFLYKGRVSVRGERLESLLDAAKWLDLRLLQDVVESAIRILRPGSSAIGKDTEDLRQRKAVPGKESSCRTNAEKSSGNLEAIGRPQSYDKINVTAAEVSKKTDELNSNSSSGGVKEGVKTTPIAGRVPKTNEILKRKSAPGGWRQLPPETPNGVVIQCEFCRYSTTSQVRMDVHVAGVHPANPVVYKCAHCKYESTRLVRYNSHVYTAHGIKPNGELVSKSFKCAECPYAAVSACLLRMHERSKHATEKKFKCEQCPYATNRKASVGDHFRRVHLGEDVHAAKRNFICETCGQRTMSLSSLAKHNRTHTGEKPHSCDICGKVFGDQSTFRRHRQKHSGDLKQHVCEVCGRAFDRRSNLKVHLKNVHKIVAPEQPNLFAGLSMC